MKRDESRGPLGGEKFGADVVEESDGVGNPPFEAVIGIGFDEAVSGVDLALFLDGNVSLLAQDVLFVAVDNAEENLKFFGFGGY